MVLGPLGLIDDGGVAIVVACTVRDVEQRMRYIKRAERHENGPVTTNI